MLDQKCKHIGFDRSITELLIVVTEMFYYCDSELILSINHFNSTFVEWFSQSYETRKYLAHMHSICQKIARSGTLGVGTK